MKSPPIGGYPVNSPGEIAVGVTAEMGGWGTIQVEADDGTFLLPTWDRGFWLMPPGGMTRWLIIPRGIINPDVTLAPVSGDANSG